MDGDIVIDGISSATGLVRGVGLYTHSELTFGDESRLSVSDLSAGHSLYSMDTTTFTAPYNPSVAKPFHVIWSLTNSRGDTFDSAITGQPAAAQFKCIYGRDGADDEDWIFKLDNAHCSDPKDSEWTHSEQQREEAISSSFISKIQIRGQQPLMVMVAASVVIAAAMLLFGSRSKSKWTSTAIFNENAPLLRC